MDRPQPSKTTGQSAGFNPLSLLRHATSSPLFGNGSGRTDQPHQGQPPSLFMSSQEAARSQSDGASNFSSMAIIRPSNAMTQYSQLHHDHDQQQQHQQQQQNAGSMLNEATTDQLVSLALSGDLEKAIQLASLALQQTSNQTGEKRGSTCISAGNGPVSGGQNLQLLQMLQSLSVQQANRHRKEKTDAESDEICPTHSAGLNMAARDGSDDYKTCLEAVKQKGQRTIVVPCRARGMPMEHNFQVGKHVLAYMNLAYLTNICGFFAANLDSIFYDR